MKKVSRKNQPSFDPQARPLLIVLSGPSGVGKDAVLARMKELACPLKFITTTTTRARRHNERDNVDYHFTSQDKFKSLIENHELLEWANVYGNWYGVPKEDVRQALAKGQDVILKVDVQGAATIKKIVPQALFIFLMCPSREDLFKRLSERHTESTSDLELRLKTADEEIRQIPQFDYVVLNRWDEIDRAVNDILAIITAEKCKVKQREIKL